MGRSTGKRYYGVDLLDLLCVAGGRVCVGELLSPDWGTTVPVDPDLLELYVDEITWEPWLDDDFDNDDNFDDPQLLRAKIAGAQTEEVERSTGDVVVTTHAIALDDVYPIGLRDRITMPARFLVSQPPIAKILPATDEEGDHHTTIVVGRRKGANA